ncbi:MAG: type II toxin-antitoxin system VapC family toxin [Bryobacteraceae bacterium]
MQEVVELEPQAAARSSNHEPPLAFLDTDVVLSYLRGDPTAVELFRAESEGRIRFAINHLVLGELILTADDAAKPALNRILEHLKVLPLDYPKAKALTAAVARSMDTPNGQARSRTPHPADMVNASGLGDSDFLVTSNGVLKSLVAGGKPRVVTPDELVAYLQSA